MENRIDTIFIQNILTPYRSHFFNTLNRVYSFFEVFYMDTTEIDRNWDVSRIELKHNHWIDVKGINLKIGWYKGHFNPILIYKLLTSKNVKNIVLAVSWADPNIIIISFAKLLHLTSKRIFFWAEANYLAEWTKKHNSRFKWWLKRKVFSSVDGAMIIPGKMSSITFEKWNIPVHSYIMLPNTIDDSKLKYKKIYKAPNSIPEFLLPIRIIEKVKGALNFFNAIGLENITKCIFHIAGDGEDMDMYKEYIKNNDLSNYIILEGFCEFEKMNELYNSCDALILPSYSDPSPLSIVEALYFHKPILCSNHCGNHFEAVKEGVNGYTFSPLDKNDIKEKFELFLSKSFFWDTMGEDSFKIYESEFNTETVVNRFVQSFDKMKK